MNTRDHKNDKKHRSRRQYPAGEKVRLLKLHLVEGQSISTICDEHQIHPTLFYAWQKTFFENGAAAFERSPGPRKKQQEETRIEKLEAQIQRKDEVIAAVTEELVRTKKQLGED
jgi:transposase